MFTKPLFKSRVDTKKTFLLQKEYEAMKLVNLFDRMVSQGAVKPARIGPDGRPQPVEHVLEFRDHPPNRPQS